MVGWICSVSVVNWLKLGPFVPANDGFEAIDSAPRSDGARFIWRGKFCWRATPALPAGPWVRVVKGIEGCRPEVNWGYMHLGSEPLRQFRYQSHKPPSVLISPEHCFDAGRPAHDRIPTVRDRDAERSRHASKVPPRPFVNSRGPTPLHTP
jgi:hypothetical protein